MSAAKPVAGVDTPRADDIIVPCACGKCGKWLVIPHPRYTSGGEQILPQRRSWKATPEWAEAEAARLAKGGQRRAGCGPSLTPLSAEQEAERERIEALKDWGPEEFPGLEALR